MMVLIYDGLTFDGSALQQIKALPAIYNGSTFNGLALQHSMKVQPATYQRALARKPQSTSLKAQA